MVEVVMSNSLGREGEGTVAEHGFGANEKATREPTARSLFGV